MSLRNLDSLVLTFSGVYKSTIKTFFIPCGLKDVFFKYDKYLKNLISVDWLSHKNGQILL